MSKTRLFFSIIFRTIFYVTGILLIRYGLNNGESGAMIIVGYLLCGGAGAGSRAVDRLREHQAQVDEDCGFEVWNVSSSGRVTKDDGTSRGGCISYIFAFLFSIVTTPLKILKLIYILIKMIITKDDWYDEDEY